MVQFAAGRRHGRGPAEGGEAALSEQESFGISFHTPCNLLQGGAADLGAGAQAADPLGKKRGNQVI